MMVDNITMGADGMRSGPSAGDASTPEWDGICHRSIDIQVKAINEEERSVDIIASTTAIDSHGDILEQDWRLERFHKNPVVLWHHNIFESSRWSMGEGIRPEDLLPIGHAKDTRVEDGKLQAKLVFGSKEFNPMSEKVFLGFKEGHIKATSVGFRPGKITEEMMDGGGTIFRLSQNELMEISVVPIPSNPETVARSAAFERTHFGRQAATVEERPIMMSDEEKAAFAQAQDKAKSATERADKAEAGLKVEKAASSKLTEELEKASKRADAAESVVTEQKVTAMVGKKIYPAEKDEFVKLAGEIGIKRVEQILEKRPKIGLTDPVTVAGKGVSDDQNPPPPAEGDEGDASAEITKTAIAASRAN